MKKFIINIFWFSSILFFIFPIEACISMLNKNLFLEQKMDSIYINEGSNYKWINKIDNKKILLLGSSSVRYGLSCSLLNSLANDTLSFVNLAMDARDPIQTYFILKQIDLTNVKAVCFGLDSFIYTKSYYKYRNVYLYLDLSFFSGLMYAIEYDKSFFSKRYKSFYKYLFSSNNNNNNNCKTEIPIDFGSVKLESNPINFDKPADEIYQLEKYGWSKLQFVYLEKIVLLCKRKKIDFYSFIPPKRSDYSNSYKKTCNIIHDEFVKNLLSMNFTEPIFGKFNQLDTLGDNDLFKEAYHLNSRGQEIYSKLFFKMLIDNKEKFSSNYKWFNEKNQMN